MVIERLGNLLVGTSTERIAHSTTNLLVNTRFLENDTERIARWNGTAWIFAESFVGSYTWLVYKSGTTYRAKSGVNGYVPVASISTDATVTIQYALDNLTPGRTWKEGVKLRGDFTITKAGAVNISIPSYTALNCVEAKLTQGVSNFNMIANADLTNGNSDIEIIGGIFDGNKAGQSAGGSEDTQSMIRFEKCSRVHIHDGTFKNGDFHNIRLRYCPGPVTITNIISMDARHEHISAHSHDVAANDYIIANSTFTGGQTPIATVNVADCIIANNHASGTLDGTSCIAPNGRRTIVIGNTLLNISGWGILTSQAVGANFDTSDSIIANNIIKTATKHAIAVASAQPGSNIIVKGNIVDGVSGGTDQGISIGPNWTDVTVADNIVCNIAGAGILVYSLAGSLSKRCKIINNIVYNCGQTQNANDDYRAGITIASDIFGNITEIAAENNKCFDIQATKTQKYGVRMVRTKDCIVKNNDLTNNLTTALNVVIDAGSVIANNEGDIFQPRRKGGQWSGYSASSGSGDGIFGSEFTSPAAGTIAAALTVTDKDRWLIFPTLGTTGSVAGPRINNGLITARGLNPVYHCRFRLVQTTNSTLFIGLKDNTNITGDDMLNALTGIGVGWRSTDTNFQIFHNDAAGATVVTQIVPTTAKNGLMHVVEIKAIDQLATWEVKFDDNAPQAITLNIPTQGGAMTVVNQVRNTAAEVKNLEVFWFDVQNDAK